MTDRAPSVTFGSGPAITAEPIGRSRPMAAIELNGLTKRFGAVTAVDD